MRFAVAGEGFPAAKILEKIIADERAELVGAYAVPQSAKRLAALAQKAGIGLSDMADLRAPDAAEKLRRLRPDWLINANSTVIFARDLLSVPPQGCLNLHPGLLPEYAGLHVHQWAIRNGEREFGATIHFIAPALDAGDIVRIARIPIHDSDTGLSLFQRCMEAGVAALLAVLDCLLAGEALPRIPQDTSLRHVYRHKDALDARIDWSTSAQRIVDFVRAGNYEPFASPSYTAELDPVDAGAAPQLLRAAPASGASAPSGTLLGFDGDDPVVAAGSGAVALRRARARGRIMTRDDWAAYFDALPKRRLRGRGRAD